MRGGKKEYKCEWTDIDPKTGKVWEPSWQMASTVTPDLIKAYESRRAVGIPSKPVTVDAAIAFHVMRRTLAHALMFGAPQEAGFQGHHRPRVHKIVVGIASLEPVAVAILEIARTLGGPGLKLVQGNVGKPNQFCRSSGSSSSMTSAASAASAPSRSSSTRRRPCRTCA